MRTSSPPSAAQLLALGVLLMASAALASRAFKEPRALRRVPGQMGEKAGRQALDAMALGEACKDGHSIRARDLLGVRCRLGIIAGQAKSTPLKTARSVKKAFKNSSLLAQTGNAVAAFTPLNPPPAFARQRFDATATACTGLWYLRDALSAAAQADDKKIQAALDRGHRGLAKEWGHGIREEACACTKKAVGNAGEAGAGMDETGALQQVLTSRGCLLDMGGDGRALNPQRAGPQSRFSGRAAGMAAESSDQGQLLAYAKSRSFTLKRCLGKFAPKGVAKDKGGLEGCVCPAINRWRFPARPQSENDVEMSLPLSQGGIVVQATIAPDGAVKTCGPVEQKRSSGPGR